MKKIISYFILLLLGWVMIIISSAYGQDLSEISQISGKMAYKTTLDNNEVIIGDEKLSTFKPQVELTKWDKECSLKFRYRTTEILGTPTLDNNKITSESLTEKARIYNIDENNLEFEIEIKEKGNKNVFEWDIIGGENYEFLYQPELTQEEIDDGCYRPDNVIGSYAIYHKTNINNKYKTGKFGHIFRPKTIDAKGNWQWADLNIDTDTWILSISCNKEWMDKASRPVIIDPTIGYTSIGASQNNPAATNVISAYVWSADNIMSEDGTSNNVFMHINGGQGASDQFAFAIYLASGSTKGSPGALVAYSTTTTEYPTSDQWVSLGVSGSLSNGNLYYPAVHTYDNGFDSLRLSYDTTGAGPADYRYSDNELFSNGFSDPYANPPDASAGYRIISAYIEYTTGEPPAVTPAAVPSQVISHWPGR